MGKRFRGGPEDWLKWLVSGDADLSQEARMALGGIFPADGVAPDHFLASLSSSDDTIVFWSVVALAQLGPASLAAIPNLVEISARHDAFGIRQAAVDALSRIGPDHPAVKPAVLAALKDQSPFVRRDALQALIAIPGLQREDLLTIGEMAHDPDGAVSRWSEIALHSIRANRGDA